MRLVLSVALLYTVAPAAALAQGGGEPPPVPPHSHSHGSPPASTHSTPPPTAQPVDVPVEARIPIGARVGETPSGYNSAGRRDPFVSLIQPRRVAVRDTGGVIRAVGLPSLSVVDVRVAGILRLGEQFVAILEGPDKRSFNARVKDRLLDAVVKSIDAGSVVFVEQSDGGGPGREIRKTIRRAAEEIR
jgi:hypothetical protein